MISLFWFWTIMMFLIGFTIGYFARGMESLRRSD